MANAQSVIGDRTWHLQPRMWAFLNGRRIVREQVCDMNGADVIGMDMVKTGDCEAWTLSAVARELCARDPREVT